MNEFTHTLKALETLMNKKTPGSDIKLNWGIVGTSIYEVKMIDNQTSPFHPKTLFKTKTDKELMLEVLRQIETLVEELYI